MSPLVCQTLTRRTTRAHGLFQVGDSLLPKRGVLHKEAYERLQHPHLSHVARVS
jgi:hypothetical protein